MIRKNKRQRKSLDIIQENTGEAQNTEKQRIKYEPQAESRFQTVTKL